MVKRMAWLFDGKAFMAVLLTLPGCIEQYEPEIIANSNVKKRRKSNKKVVAMEGA